MFDHEERFCLLAYVVEMVRVVGLWAVVKQQSIRYKDHSQSCVPIFFHWSDFMIEKQSFLK